MSTQWLYITEERNGKLKDRQIIFQIQGYRKYEDKIKKTHIEREGLY